MTTKSTARKPAAKTAAKRTTKRAAPTPRKTAKAPQKRTRTKATSEPALTPVPDGMEPEQPQTEEEEGLTLDEATREQLREHLDDDQIDAILPLLGGIHEHGRSVGRFQARADVAGDLRFLSSARADYDQGNAPDPADMTDDQKAACIRAEHVAANWLAGIIELNRSPAGWLPSWRWGEWKARLSSVYGIEVKDD